MEISPKPAPARNAVALSIISRTEAGTSFTASPAPGEDSGVTIHPAVYVKEKEPIDRSGLGHEYQGKGSITVPCGSRLMTW